METDFSVALKTPTKCSKAELDAFEGLVSIGDEVIQNGLRNRIEGAYFLALGKIVNGEVVGVAALKNPNNNYRRSVFEKSYSKEEPNQWQAELGWIFVRNEYRNQGLATRLVKELFSSNTPMNVYATAREKNNPILPLLKKFGFVQSGQVYPSENGDYNLVLYIKQD